MALWLKQSTSVVISFGPFVLNSDGVTLVTNLVGTGSNQTENTTTGIRISKNGGAFAARHATATASTYDAYGNYLVTLDSTDTGSLGVLRVQFVNAAAFCPVWMDFEIVAANIYDSFIGGGDVLDISAIQILGTAISTPATAGILDVNIKNMNNVAATSITTINANQGTTQPINFTGTAGSALAKSDMVDVAGAAVSASTAQLGVNVVNIKGTASAGTAGYVAPDWSAINAPTTVVDLSGTTIKNVDNAIANVTTVTGNVNGSVGSVTGAVGSVAGNIGGNVVGSVASVTGAVGSVTGNVGGNVVGSVASVTNRVTANTDQWAGGTIPAPNVTGIPIIDLKYILGTLLTETAGQIAAGFKKFFNVSTPTLRVDSGGTDGKSLLSTDNQNLANTLYVNAANVGGQTAANYAVAVAFDVWEELSAIHSGSAGSYGKLLSDDIDATISSRASASALTSLQSNVTTILGNYARRTGDYNTIAPDNASITNIKTKTDQLRFTVALQVDANALSGGGGGGGGGLDAAGVRDAIGMANPDLDAQLAAIASYIDTEISAIKSKTDALPNSGIASQASMDALSAKLQGMTSLADWLRTMARGDNAHPTAVTEINS